MKKSPRFIALIAVAAAAGALAYLRWLRPWQLTWGATPDEVRRPLPGDDLVPYPHFDATRAITIAARPELIWPWLRQVGVDRAGWYSYDLLDNLGRPSARQIIPELQALKVGDLLPMSPDGHQGIRVHALDLPRSMIWGTPGDTSWVWVAEPRDDGTTRLITRVRSRYRWLSPSIAFSVILEFGDIWMMRKMLRTLQLRAEELAVIEHATRGASRAPEIDGRAADGGRRVAAGHPDPVGTSPAASSSLPPSAVGRRPIREHDARPRQRRQRRKASA